MYNEAFTDLLDVLKSGGDLNDVYEEELESIPLHELSICNSMFGIDVEQDIVSIDKKEMKSAIDIALDYREVSENIKRSAMDNAHYRALFHIDDYNAERPIGLIVLKPDKHGYVHFPTSKDYAKAAEAARLASSGAQIVYE